MNIPPFLRENWLLLVPPLFGFIAIYTLLPQVRRRKPIWGGALAAVALVLGAAIFLRNDTGFAETLLFYAFAGIAVVAGGMMITQSNPVHAALSFALVVLSTCGLFLLQAAPFLMAATIIVYAGAIVVTFLFVIMLAQQEGPSSADQRSREPFLATLAGCVLMASLVCILHRTYQTRELDALFAQLQQLAEVTDQDGVTRILGEPPTKGEIKIVDTPPLILQMHRVLGDQDLHVVNKIGDIHKAWTQGKLADLKDAAASLQAMVKARRDTHASIRLDDVPGKKKDSPGHFLPGKLPANNVAALGRVLFTDYLVPVELAAVLLLVATIGAIVIGGRRSEELR